MVVRKPSIERILLWRVDEDKKLPALERNDTPETAVSLTAVLTLHRQYVPASAASAQAEVAQNEQDDDHGPYEPDDAVHDCLLPNWRFSRKDGCAVQCSVIRLGPCVPAHCAVPNGGSKYSSGTPRCASVISAASAMVRQPRHPRPCT